MTRGSYTFCAKCPVTSQPSGKSSLPYHFVYDGCSMTNTKVLFSQSVMTVK